MSDQQNPDRPIDEAARHRFETACHEDAHARIEDFLPAIDDPSYLPTLEELVLVDLEESWRRWDPADKNERPDLVEAYLLRFANLDDAATIARLALEEYRIRHQHGDHPPVDSYAERFGDIESGGMDILAMLQASDAYVDAVVHEPKDGVPPRGERKQYLGRYELIGELGEGCFARVFLARDPLLDREIAIKLMCPELFSDEHAVARAERIAHMRHPGIVSVYEVGEIESRPYLVTEYIPGGTLADVLAQRTVEPRQAAEWTAQLADALQYGHTCAVMHRDVTPSNILMRDSVEPMLADFGLTPLARDNAPADVQADICSLGAVLYAMLCGRPPHDGNWSMCPGNMTTYKQRPPRQDRPDIDRDLETICLKAIAHEPEQRYASAAEFAEDLRRYLSHRPILARPLRPLARCTLWCQRNPNQAMTTGVAIIILIAMMTIGLWRMLQERGDFRQQRDTAQANLYDALLGEADGMARVRDTAWWPRAMDNVKQAAALDVADRDHTELGDMAVRFTSSAYSWFNLECSWIAHDTPIRAVACRHEANLVATGSASGAITIWQARIGEPFKQLAGHTAAVTGLAFSDDGRTLVSCSEDGTIQIWSVHDTPSRGGVEALMTLDAKAGPLSALGQTPDGSTIAVGAEDGTVTFVYDWTNAPRMLRLPGHEGRVHDLRFSSDGEQMVTCGADGYLQIFDANTGRIVDRHRGKGMWRSADFGSSPGAFVALAPETWKLERLTPTGTIVDPGRAGHTGETTIVRGDSQGRAFTASHDGTLRVWASGGFEQLAIASDDAFAGMLTFARVPFPSERQCTVFAGYEDGRAALWTLHEPEHRRYGGSDRDVTFLGDTLLVSSTQVSDVRAEPHGDSYIAPVCRAIAVHPDGELFAAGDESGDIQITSVSGDDAVFKRFGHDAAISSLAIDDAGQWILSADESGAARLWPWDDKGPAWSTQPDIGEINRVGFLPDRRVFLSGQKAVIIADIETGTTIHRLVASTHRGGDAVLVGGYLAIGTTTGQIVLFDTRTGQPRRTLNGHTGAIYSLCASANDLYSGSADRTIRRWDTTTWQQTAQMPTPLPARWLDVHITGRYLLVGTNLPLGNGVWDVETGQQCATLAVVVPHFGVFTPAGTEALLGVRSGGIARLRDEQFMRPGIPGLVIKQQAPSKPRVIAQLETVIEGGHMAPVICVAATPDGDRFVTCDVTGFVKVWKPGSNELVRTLGTHGNAAVGLAVSPDGRYAATGFRDIRIWDLHSGAQTFQLNGHERFVSGLAFSPNEPALVSGGLDKTLRVWNLQTGSLVSVLHVSAGAVPDVAFSADGRYLAAAAGDAGVLIWDLANTKLLNTSPRAPDVVLTDHQANAWAVGFNHSGTELASADDSGNVVLRSPGDWKRIMTLPSDSRQLRSIAYSADDRYLAAGSIAGRSVVWDLVGMRQMLTELGLE